jgi:hypothetical protein
VDTVHAAAGLPSTGLGGAGAEQLVRNSIERPAGAVFLLAATPALRSRRWTPATLEPRSKARAMRPELRDLAARLRSRKVERTPIDATVTLPHHDTSCPELGFKDTRCECLHVMLPIFSGSVIERP